MFFFDFLVVFEALNQSLSAEKVTPIRQKGFEAYT